MDTETVAWVPASVAELTDRPRLVRTTDEPGVSIESILLGLGVVVGPAAIIAGSPQPLAGRAAVGFGFGLLMLASTLFSLHGLYLSRQGVTVWRGVLPRRPVRWADAEEFCLISRPIDLGRRSSERVALRVCDGTTIECWWMNRTRTFETQGLRVASAKARMRSLPELVDQLNRLRDEVVGRSGPHH